MNVLITGSQGFIGKNLQLRLTERKDVQVVCFSRQSDSRELFELLKKADFIFHLAGVNRSADPEQFEVGNTELTQSLVNAVCELAETTGKKIPIVYTSSAQAVLYNNYGVSKKKAESALEIAKARHAIPVRIFRLPNVFGKWCKPNYNSVVATFCHNIARGISINIHDPAAKVDLVYIDDVIDRFIDLMEAPEELINAATFAVVEPQYATTVGEIAAQIKSFKDSRDTLLIDKVGVGFKRALYSTYVSYLPPESFVYSVPQYEDARGKFVEMLKTPDTGQFSFFTAHPGVTRGGHYHHSKTEKFLVIKGKALFKFRHMISGAIHELTVNGEKSEIVETVPGWTHDITNAGDTEMIVMLWANEVFNRDRPDTISSPL